MIRASVVIPARGRSLILVRALQLLDDSDGSDFEIVVVADHCRETVAAVEALELRHPCRLYEIPGQPSAPFGAAEARNLGARFASGELLVFLDADCLVGAGHVQGFLEAFEPETLLLGPIDYVATEDWTKPLAGELRPAFSAGAEPPEGTDPHVWLGSQCWTGNMAIERRAFCELGGFDQGFLGTGGEDLDFGLRCVARFGRAARVASRVRHVGPTAAFAHLRGEPGPLEHDGVARAVEAGRYAGGGSSLCANGGEAFFRDPDRWAGVRDLRAGTSRPVDAPTASQSVTDVLQAQLERSAAALVAIARRLDRAPLLDGGEAEFLELYGGVVAADPSAFSRAWSDPQAHAWVKGAFDRLEGAVRTPSAEANEALGRALEGFKLFALACAHLAGERLTLRSGFSCPEQLAIPGTRYTIEGAGGLELRGISGTHVFLARVGEPGIGEPRPLQPDASAATPEARVRSCPVLGWNGSEIRVQPAAFRTAEGEPVPYLYDWNAEAQGAHLPVLGEALAILERFSSEAAELAGWIEVVAFNPIELADVGNTSSSELPGAICLLETHDALELAETLVHELHHQRLFAAEIEGSLFADEAQNAGTDFHYYSPWRVEPRPMKGLLHAFYVFTSVARHWLSVLDGCDSSEGEARARARDRLADVGLQLPMAYETIRAHARLSKIGQRLFDATTRHYEDVLARIAAGGIASSEAERRVEAHVDAFDSDRVLARLRPRLSFSARSEPRAMREGRSSRPPRISCLCVTRGRVERLDRAVRCFQSQTHPNRELVLLYEDDDPETARYAEAAARSTPEIVSVGVARDSEAPLGVLRNLAVSRSGGDYVCQWDDDDWYHPERLADQWQALSESPGAAACVLSRWTVFDEARGRAYLSPHRPWEGSLLCRRDALPAYPSLGIGEDTPVVEALQRSGGLVALEKPKLYVYVAHGDNTFPESHFESFFDESLYLGSKKSAELAEAMAKGAV